MALSQTVDGKNEQQADFEVQLENNCNKLGGKLQPNVRKNREKFSGFYVNLRLGEHL